jgi:hypothetical protein
MIDGKELADLMAQAARRATVACIERGYSRGDKVTKDSARAAAEEVYRRERPEDWVPPQAPVVPLPRVEDPVKDRIAP